jgi:hypothetical protein
MSKRKRAAAGSGSIFPHRRKNDQGVVEQVGWCGMVDLGILDGKRQRKTVYGKSQREVRDRVNELLRDHQKGVMPRAGKLTVEQYLRVWLASSEARVRPRTLEHYRWLVESHLIPSVGRRQLEKLTATDVEALMAAKLKAGMSPRSCHHLRSLLRNALNKAVRDGLVVRNVAAMSDPLEVPRFEIRILTPAQVKIFLAAAHGEPLEALWTTVLGLALREGEGPGAALAGRGPRRRRAARERGPAAQERARPARQGARPGGAEVEDLAPGAAAVGAGAAGAGGTPGAADGGQPQRLAPCLHRAPRRTAGGEVGAAGVPRAAGPGGAAPDAAARSQTLLRQPHARSKGAGEGGAVDPRP